jgi:hypothetical protein
MEIKPMIGRTETEFRAIVEGLFLQGDRLAA